MILTAIEKGVPQERLARALNVNIHSIQQKKSLLDGICPEAIDLLKDKHVPVNTIGQLKKMKPMRQIESAQLMTAMNKYSITYARSLVAATPERCSFGRRSRSAASAAIRSRSWKMKQPTSNASLRRSSKTMVPITSTSF
ncbi:plasmid partitioning protein RepB C-terminal domain-containing protein [Ensifer oleiphilus]|uniref:plasmid partitioning protein RepB C-terminal domain-containing protein n=1 Tax=Ensifer oleiphilus TaxID=2742698 RepID=UPI003CCEB3DF